VRSKSLPERLRESFCSGCDGLVRAKCGNRPSRDHANCHDERATVVRPLKNQRYGALLTLFPFTDSDSKWRFSTRNLHTSSPGKIVPFAENIADSRAFS
jgi:hypothetical protein